jgi:hypothetical protein
VAKALSVFLSLTGCTYLSERARDFGDCFKFDVHLSPPGAWVHAGPIAEDGLGAPEMPYLGMTLGGWRYGYDHPKQEGHSEFPMQLYGVIGHVSSMTGMPTDESEHRCLVLLPSLLSLEGIHRYPLQDFDVEIGASAIIAVSIGFSSGECLDFLLGRFGIDLAGDDPPEGRNARDKARSHYRARRLASAK